jgi:hypothetical protein
MQKCHAPVRRQIDTVATRVLINDDAAPHSLAITWARSRLKRGEARGPRLGSSCLRRRFARAAAGGDTGQRLETCTPAARSSRVPSELPAPDFCRSSPPPPTGCSLSLREQCERRCDEQKRDREMNIRNSMNAECRKQRSTMTTRDERVAEGENNFRMPPTPFIEEMRTTMPRAYLLLTATATAIVT